MNTILDVLNAVDEEFSSPDKWTKGTYARNADGIPCVESDPTATCHCLVGCIIYVSPEKYDLSLANKIGNETFVFLKSFFSIKETYSNLHSWNDAPERSFTDVKNLLKTAKEKFVKKHLKA